ncbi:hypothetical protein [Methylobrevis pamukkalensis]|uniref:GcrA cell cycle regulator n=1 Tax=Methylobrevis pamukkalensis TaxID=1439726 RepID=A0A1E3H226_9HYPH|nr:hypothetical protein [Methylobrevis pamukkalensis]ODN70195.1 GcrA cell cycle regulator [Methylobrevis pamukkalensis]
MSFPSPHVLARVILAACRITGEAPEDVVRGAMGLRARHYALAGLIVAFPEAEKRSLARCLGYGSVNSAASNLGQCRRSLWWREENVDACRVAALCGAVPAPAPAPASSVPPPVPAEPAPVAPDLAALSAPAFRWADMPFEDRVQEVRRRLDAGMSLAGIATALGAQSRGAIVGFIDRNLRKDEREPRPERPLSSARAEKPSPAPPVVLPEILPPPEGTVTLFSAGLLQCRNPLWGAATPGPERAFVCGAPVVPPTSYCRACGLRLFAGKAITRGSMTLPTTSNRHATTRPDPDRRNRPVLAASGKGWA